MTDRTSTMYRREFLQHASTGLSGLALMGGSGWASASLAQSGPKRIYIAPDDHTDYLWSGDEETYRQAMVGMLDYYLDLADATEKEPAEHQSRWNCDGSFWVWEYERSKPAADVERLVRRIRDGHISVPLNALVSTYGGAISDPNVVLWALKPAEDGIDKGIVARVWNLASAPGQFSLSVAGGLSAASAVTHIETDIGPATVSRGALVTSVAGLQMKTFRLNVTTQTKGK